MNLSTHRQDEGANRTFMRVPPQDVPAEQSAAGAMLLSPTAIAEVRGTITAADFYLPAHAEVFTATCELPTVANRSTRSPSHPSWSAAAP